MTTLTPNLKLRVSDNLTSDAKYNLFRLDSLASTYLIDSLDTLNIRSKVNINLLPEDASIGGSGVGGIINLSTSAQYLTEVNINSNQTFLGKNLLIDDNASGGNKRLKIFYKSDLNGPTDTLSNRELAIDLEGSNRELVLGSNLSILGSTSLVLNLTAPTNVILPTTGTLATLANIETFTNKTIDANFNTILNLTNVNIGPSAGIEYSKLNLNDSIVNSDINTNAGIVYSKLNLNNSIINADINTNAGIVYSKLNLTGSIVDSDIAIGANIAGHKLNLANHITDSMVNSFAAIHGTKIFPDFGIQDIITSGKIGVRGIAHKTEFIAATGGQTMDLLFILPPNHGPGVLQNDGFGNLSWAIVTGTGTVTSVGLSMPASVFSVTGSPITSSGTISVSLNNQSANTIFAGPTTGAPAAPSFRALDILDLPNNIPATLIADGSVDNTEFQALDGVTSNIQTQLDNKQPLDSLLTAISGLTSNGIIVRTSASSANSRSIVGQPYLPIINGDGVSGNPTLDINIFAATTVSPDASDYLLISDTSDSNNIKKIQVSDLLDMSGASFAADWTSGTSISLTHGLNSRDILIEVYDKNTYETIIVDSIVRTTLNVVDLTSSVAPTGLGWRVIIKRI